MKPDSLPPSPPRPPSSPAEHPLPLSLLPSLSPPKPQRFPPSSPSPPPSPCHFHPFNDANVSDDAKKLSATHDTSAPLPKHTMLPTHPSPERNRRKSNNKWSSVANLQGEHTRMAEILAHVSSEASQLAKDLDTAREDSDLLVTEGAKLREKQREVEIGRALLVAQLETRRGRLKNAMDAFEDLKKKCCIIIGRRNRARAENHAKLKAEHDLLQAWTEEQKRQLLHLQASLSQRDEHFALSVTEQKKLTASLMHSAEKVSNVQKAHDARKVRVLRSENVCQRLGSHCSELDSHQRQLHTSLSRSVSSRSAITHTAVQMSEERLRTYRTASLRMRAEMESKRKRLADSRMKVRDISANSTGLQMFDGHKNGDGGNLIEDSDQGRKVSLPERPTEYTRAHIAAATAEWEVKCAAAQAELADFALESAEKEVALRKETHAFEEMATRYGLEAEQAKLARVNANQHMSMLNFHTELGEALQAQRDVLMRSKAVRSEILENLKKKLNHLQTKHASILEMKEAEISKSKADEIAQLQASKAKQEREKASKSAVKQWSMISTPPSPSNETDAGAVDKPFAFQQGRKTAGTRTPPLIRAERLYRSSSVESAIASLEADGFTSEQIALFCGTNSAIDESDIDEEDCSGPTNQKNKTKAMESRKSSRGSHRYGEQNSISRNIKSSVRLSFTHDSLPCMDVFAAMKEEGVPDKLIAKEMLDEGFPRVIVGAFLERGPSSVTTTAKALKQFPELEKFELLRQEAVKPCAGTQQERTHATPEKLMALMAEKGFAEFEINAFLSGGADSLFEVVSTKATDKEDFASTASKISRASISDSDFNFQRSSSPLARKENCRGPTSITPMRSSHSTALHKRKNVELPKTFKGETLLSRRIGNMSPEEKKAFIRKHASYLVRKRTREGVKPFFLSS